MNTCADIYSIGNISGALLYNISSRKMFVPLFTDITASLTAKSRNFIVAVERP